MVSSFSKVYPAGYWGIQGSSEKHFLRVTIRSKKGRHKIRSNMPEFWLLLSLKIWLSCDEQLLKLPFLPPRSSKKRKLFKRTATVTYNHQLQLSLNGWKYKTMEGQEEMLRDISGGVLCNLLSTLKSIWDFKGACDKTTGHTSRIWKNSTSSARKIWTNSFGRHCKC